MIIYEAIQTIPGVVFIYALGCIPLAALWYVVAKALDKIEVDSDE